MLLRYKFFIVAIASIINVLTVFASNIDPLVERVLKAQMYGYSFEEIQDGWIALGEIEEIKDRERRIKAYLDLTNYHIGEGNSEYLGELIAEEGLYILYMLHNKITSDISCYSEYSKICKEMESRNTYLRILISIIKEDAMEN